MELYIIEAHIPLDGGDITQSYVNSLSASGGGIET